MRNLIVCCVTSAVLGGAVAAWLVDEDYRLASFPAAGRGPVRRVPSR